MPYRSEQIALYLNLATSHLEAREGNLSELTTSNQTIAYNAGNHEETQCLAMMGALWIANNDDSDTDTQRALLNKLGIDTHDALANYVDQYQTLVLKHHAGVLTRQNLPTAKQKFLYDLADADGAIPPAKPARPAVPAAVNNQPYSLASNNAPPVAGIVFIKGNYAGSITPDGNQHAEQKLLAALSKCYAKAFNKGVHIFGCKVACSVCEEVLANVKQKLKSKGVTLKYEDPIAERIREEAGLPQVNPQGIRDLDVDTYFA
jgi:hypothetical protein